MALIDPLGHSASASPLGLAHSSCECLHVSVCRKHEIEPVFVTSSLSQGVDDPVTDAWYGRCLSLLNTTRLVVAYVSVHE